MSRPAMADGSVPPHDDACPVEADRSDCSKGAMFRRVIAAIEPWYDWGPSGIVSVRDDIDGDGWRFNIDWLGLHLGIMVGRTPKAVRS